MHPLKDGLPLHKYLFQVVPRLFHGAGRASTSSASRFPLFLVFLSRKKGVQETVFMARAVETENAGNTMKRLPVNLGTDWE